MESTSDSTAVCYCEDGSVVDNEIKFEGAWGDETLECVLCHAQIHIKCLKAPAPTVLLNDYLYQITCARCMSSGEEGYVRPPKLQLVYIVSLLLHNLQSTEEGRLGFFHYKKDINKLFLQHQLHLCPQTGNRCGNTSSALSTYSGQFESGTRYLGEHGWWRLRENKPPFLSKAYSRIHVEPDEPQPTSLKRADRKKKKLSDDYVTLGKRKGGASKKAKKEVCVSNANRATQRRPKDETDAMQEETVDVVDETELSNIKSPSPISPLVKLEHADLFADLSYMADGEKTLEQFEMDISASDLKLELSAGLDIETSALCDELTVPDTNTPTPPRAASPLASTTEMSLTEDENKPLSAEKETSDFPESCDPSTQVTAEDNNKLERTESPQAMEQECIEQLSPVKIKKWSVYEEDKLLSILNTLAQSQGSLSTRERLLRRMITVRKYKRSRGKPLFDISHNIIESTQNATVAMRPKTSRTSGLSAPVVQSYHSPLDRYQSEIENITADHFVPFINKLKGGAEMLRSTKSCYTARTLKPYIWRDFETQPPKLQVLNDIWRRGGGDLPVVSIDYRYANAHHIPVINKICHEAFWPSIELSECLQYSDFSCVAMYKRLIIGFAFMVPDIKHNEAYISFIYTHPEWRGAGIASIMLYHLIQTCMGKDVSLHVSMTNPAIGLYLKFGFKVVEIIHNFYDKYHPTDSAQSPHAFHMKLERY